MKITNVRERKNAITRFAIIYAVALAIPVLIVLSSLTVSNVGKKDAAEMMGRLQKRDLALSKVYQLALKLDNMQNFRQNRNYDEMRLQFEKEVDDLQINYADSITYGDTYKLVGILRMFHKQFEESGRKLENTVAEYQSQLGNCRDSIGVVGGIGKEVNAECKEQIKDLQQQLRDAQAELKDLARQSKATDKSFAQCSAQLEKCRNSVDIVDKITSGLNKIETNTNKIAVQLLSGENKRIRANILTEINNLKLEAEKIKRNLPQTSL